MGWLEETEDTEDVAHDAYPLGARIFSMLVAKSHLPQLALRCTGEFGPAAGQVSPAPPPPSAIALLVELSSPPCRSSEGFFAVTLLCDQNGTPIPRQTLRAAIQEGASCRRRRPRGGVRPLLPWLALNPIHMH